MKLRIMSDLHLEFADFRPEPAGEDAVVLAGNIHHGLRGLEWAARTFGDLPVIYVPGNHEFYGGRQIDRLIAKMREFARERAPNIRVLDNNVAVINGVRFLGTTLWTSFNLLQTLYMSMLYAEATLGDYGEIAADPLDPPPASGIDIGNLRAAQVRARHLVAAAWLDEQLAAPWPGETVVVTHHAPTPRSLPAYWPDDPLSASAASNVMAVWSSAASLWIHGHVHQRQDYDLAETRIVCNPRGFCGGQSNPMFDPGLIVEVESLPDNQVIYLKDSDIDRRRQRRRHLMGMQPNPQKTTDNIRKLPIR